MSPASSTGLTKCGGFLLCFRLRGLFAALRRLRAELLRESLDAAFRVDQLLPAGEEGMAVRTDLEVELRLGRAGLPCGDARAARLDLVVFRLNAFLHCQLLRPFAKLPLYPPGYSISIALSQRCSLNACRRRSGKRAPSAALRFFST